MKRIAVESRALAERARTNKLRSDDLGGGTFTVSNLGMFDVDEFIAIINPPERTMDSPRTPVVQIVVSVGIAKPSFRRTSPEVTSLTVAFRRTKTPIRRNRDKA